MLNRTGLSGKKSMRFPAASLSGRWSRASEPSSLPDWRGPQPGFSGINWEPCRLTALDRNAKVRIMHLARCLSRRTEKGRAYGRLTAKAVAVLEAILWTFHNAKSGLCFPSYETIAAAAHCARSTVAEAIW
jgi:hypothetical protein